MESYGRVPHTVRLALVLNGGVSLAVWMGGVAHEIDLLHRAGSHDDDAGPAATFWRSLCKQFHLRAIVDIVAGTSAGGLNGTLLASAVATGQPMPPELRQLWVDDAALTADRLLTPQERPVSLLSGQFLEDKLRDVIGRVLGGDKGTEPVTLFVTATALGGNENVGVDALGNPFQYEDHRRLYRFAFDPHRLRYLDAGRLEPDPENDFDELGHDALAAAARASASYPLAFAPVSEEVLLTADRYRVQPDVSAKDQPSAYLMDGGVLDNAPFGPVLDEIRKRPITGPYRRVLGYVVPSSGLPAGPAGPVTGEPPGGTRIGEPGSPSTSDTPRWTDVVLRALNLPREADFRSDIDELDDALSVASESPIRRLYRRMRLEPEDRRPLCRIALSLLPEYRRARATEGVWELRHELAHPPLRVTLRAPQPVDPESVLDDAARRWLPPADVQLAMPADGAWPWGLAVAHQVVLMLLRDTQESLIAPQSPTGAQPTELPMDDIGGQAERLSVALEKVRAVEAALQESLRARGRAVTSGYDTDDRVLADMIDEQFDRLDVPNMLHTIVRDAVRGYAEALLRSSDEAVSTAEIDAKANDIMAWALTSEILSRTFAPPSTSEPAAPMEFVRIGPDVTAAYPRLAALACDGDQKLFGTKLGHFGGFARSDARLRDWRWGRLDAAAHLTRLLLPANLSDEEKEEWVSRAQQAVLADEAGPHGDPEALAAELVASTDEAAGKSDPELIAELLGRQDGNADKAAAMASPLATSAVNLMTRGRLTRRQTGQSNWQAALEAAISREPLRNLPPGRKVLRWLTAGPRRSLWRTLEEEPAKLPTRMVRTIRLWAAGYLLGALLAGGLLATTITALACGHAIVAAVAALLLVGGAVVVAVRIATVH